MNEMHEIILYKKRNFSSIGVFIESSGDHVNIITEDGKILKIEKDKIYFHSKIYSKSYPNINDVKLEIRSYRKQLDNDKDSIDIKTIWECTYNKDNIYPISLQDIINLYPEYKNNNYQLLLLVWSMERDDIYFKKEDTMYLPNTDEEIQSTLKRKHDNLVRIKQRENAREWIRNILSGQTDVTPHDLEEHKTYIELIKEYSIYGEDLERSKEAKSFITEAGLKDEYDALEFLISIGLWEKDKDPIYKKYSLRNTYPSKVSSEAKSLLDKPVSYDRLVDISKLKVYSIDDENTLDIDDAISVEDIGDNFRLGIHITNVAGIIGNDSELDKEALKRGETIYLPEGNIHMFPPELAGDLLSLNENKFRKAISLFVTFDKDNHMIHHEFLQTKIKTAKNINYTEANNLIQSSVKWKRLFNIINVLRNKRISNGAVILQLPSIKIIFGDSGDITVNKNYMNTDAHNMVAECMILINTLSASYFKNKNIPALYRNQIERISEDVQYLDDRSKLFPIEAIKFLKPTQISTKPDSHRFLGVNEYVQISSPIRRYLDLVMQRQLLASLEGKKLPYNIKNLENISTRTEMAVKEKKIVEKTRERYWILKYLKDNNIDKLIGVISSVRNKRASAYFPDYLMDIPFSITSEEQTQVGNEIEFYIENIDLIRRRLSIKPI